MGRPSDEIERVAVAFGELFCRAGSVHWSDHVASEPIGVTVAGGAAHELNPPASGILCEGQARSSTHGTSRRASRGDRRAAAEHMMMAAVCSAGDGGGAMRWPIGRMLRRWRWRRRRRAPSLLNPTAIRCSFLSHGTVGTHLPTTPTASSRCVGIGAATGIHVQPCASSRIAPASARNLHSRRILSDFLLCPLWIPRRLPTNWDELGYLLVVGWTA